MKMDDNEKYENLANAIIERAVDDYKAQARKLNYLKTHKFEVLQKIVQHESKKAHPIFYTGTELQAEYNRKVRAAKYKLMNIESFFGSPWYCILTNVDGKALLQMLKEQIKEKDGIDCDLL